MTEDVKNRINEILNNIGNTCDGCEIDYEKEKEKITIYTDAGHCSSIITFKQIIELATLLSL